MATEVLVSATSRELLPRLVIAPFGPIGTMRRRIELGGLLIDQVDAVTAVERIRGFIRSGEPHQVVTVNLDFLSIARRNPAFRAAINAADLAVADGMPLVWASRWKGRPLGERVAGVELVAESCRVAAAMGASVYLLGAAPGIAQRAGERLEKLYPGLRIAGSYSPPVGPLYGEENERVLRMIRAAAPDLLFVALGAPRQDLWIRQHQPHLQVPVAMGVGCVFDLLAGSAKRAPRWMQRVGLEWAFRLSREPQRLWRRYLLNDLPMLGQLLWEALPEATEPLVVAS